MKDKVHEYLKRIDKAYSLGLIGKDCLSHAIIAHDDYCEINQNGYCNCDPDITIKTDKGEMKIDSNGYLYTEGE